MMIMPATIAIKSGVTSSPPKKASRRSALAPRIRINVWGGRDMAPAFSWAAHSITAMQTIAVATAVALVESTFMITELVNKAATDVPAIIE